MQVIALSRLSHTDVLPLLNSLVNYCISRAHDHNIAGQEAQQIVNIAEVEDPQGGGKVFGVFSSPGLYRILQKVGDGSFARISCKWFYHRLQCF